MKRGEPTTYIVEPSTTVPTTTIPVPPLTGQVPATGAAPGASVTQPPPNHYPSHTQGQFNHYPNYQRGGANNLYNHRFINYDRRGGFGRAKYDPHVSRFLPIINIYVILNCLIKKFNNFIYFTSIALL